MALAIRKSADLLFPALVTGAGLLVYTYHIIRVGKARSKYDVKAPAIEGPAEFNRIFRVQQNDVEQLVVFLPSLWGFSVFVHPLIGAAIGAGWVLGRILYGEGYYRAPEKREIGALLTFATSSALLVGALGGISYGIWKSKTHHIQHTRNHK